LLGYNKFSNFKNRITQNDQNVIYVLLAGNSRYIYVYGVHLDNASISIAVVLRLGSPAVHAHTCVCSALVLADEYHGLSCVKSAGRYMRHAAINDTINRALNGTGVHAALEPVGFCGSLGLRPDGVTLLPWTKSRSMVWDYTCPDTFAKSHLPHTSTTKGAAAERAERAKIAKYAAFQSQFDVIPVAIETLGVYASSAMAFIKDLGGRLVRTTGERRAGNFHRQRIAMALQRAV